jgi:hypothetical protein
MGVGALLKFAWDVYQDKQKKYFKTIENRNRNFGEALEYQWLLGTEKGNLAFTDDELQGAVDRGEKQKHDLTYADWE